MVGLASRFPKLLVPVCAASALLSATTSAVAAPSFRGATATAAGGSVRSLTLSKPASVAPGGDVMLSALDVRVGSVSQITAPSGWSLVRADSNGGVGVTLTQAVYMRTAGAVEPASYT